MSILGKYTENIKENDFRRIEEPSQDFEMPAVTRDDDYGSISLKKGLTISAILHPSTLLVLWLIVFSFALIGINLF